MTWLKRSIDNHLGATKYMRGAAEKQALTPEFLSHKMGKVWVPYSHTCKLPWPWDLGVPFVQCCSHSYLAP